MLISPGPPEIPSPKCLINLRESALENQEDNTIPERIVPDLAKTEHTSSNLQPFSKIMKTFQNKLLKSTLNCTLSQEDDYFLRKTSLMQKTIFYTALSNNCNRFI